MNLEARMARSGKIITSSLFYLAWENLSRIHREYPLTQKMDIELIPNPEKEIGSEGGLL